MAQVSGRRSPTTGMPLAQVYSGRARRQRGQLGDGRGILLGEQLLADGTTMDPHLKGCLTLIREWVMDGRFTFDDRESLASEAMHYPHRRPAR